MSERRSRERTVRPRARPAHRRAPLEGASQRGALRATVRPGRIRRESYSRIGSMLRRVRRQRGRARGRARFYLGPRSRLQRSVVIVSYSKNRVAGAWRAHGRYLAREGAQREGQKGLGFDAERSDVDLGRTLDAWQEEGGARLWKMIVSPEMGHRMDLRAHTRTLLSEMERELGTKFRWVAIDHYNTAHPHVHVALRGVDEQGNALRFGPHDLRRFRELSQQLATQELGLRLEHEALLARERAIQAQHVTELDRAIERRAENGGVVSFEGGVPRHPDGRERRVQEIARLQFLSTLGLAERVGGLTWRVDPDFLGTLRRLQLSRDILKTRAAARAQILDVHAPSVLTRMEPGVAVSGRVVGAGLDEGSGRAFLLVEGVDGRVHHVPQTHEMVRARGEGGLRRGQLVRLSMPERAAAPTRVRIQEFGTLEELEGAARRHTVVDLEALRWARETGGPPPPATTRRGFFAHWREALAARFPRLERLGVLRREHASAGSGGFARFRAVEGAERRIESTMRSRERTPMSLDEVQGQATKPLRFVEPQARTVYRGRMVAYAEGRGGERYAVLDTGRHWTAVRTERTDLALQSDVLARARWVEQEGEQRRVLAWQLDDLERERHHERGRER